MSDLVALAGLWQHAELDRIEIDPSSPECEGLGIGGRDHNKSRTGFARLWRKAVLGVILASARDGEIGAGRGGWDNLSIRQIARKLGISERTVQRALAELRAIGVLLVEFRHGQTNHFKVLHDKLQLLIDEGKREGIAFLNRIKAEAKEAFATVGLGSRGGLPRPSGDDAGKSDEDEVGQLVDTFDQIFQPGSALNCGFDRRTANRIMRRRGVDAYGLVEEMRDIQAALMHSKAAEATTVLDKPHLLTGKKLWARLVYLGRQHRQG